MNARWRRSWVGAAACGALLAVAGLSAGAGQAPPAGQAAQVAVAPLPPPSFGGRWELNVVSSEQVPTSDEGERAADPAGAPPTAPPGGGRSGGGPGSTGGRGGPGGLGGPDGPDATRPESFSVQEQMSRVMDAPRVLTIVQKGDVITLTTGDGLATSLKADGIKVKEQQAGAPIERTSRFDGRSLVTETRLSNGTRVTQTFTKVMEGLQLVIATRVKGGRYREPLEFKRVYDQAFQ
jgi:hypothetical protein